MAQSQAEARGEGEITASDIVGRSVIDRGAEVRESEGEVDRVFKVEEFEGGESLVVVHTDDDIVAALESEGEGGIAGERAVDRKSEGEGLCDRGLDEGLLFVADQAAISGVGIQAADGDPRVGELEPALAIAVEDLEDRKEHRGVDRAWNVGKRDMDRSGDDAEFGSGEHHHGLLDTAVFGKPFGVSDVREFAEGEGLFVDRPGDKGVDQAFFSSRESVSDVGDLGVGTRRREPSWGDIDVLGFGVVDQTEIRPAER